MSDYKAEIERRIENLKATREVAGSRFDKHTIKGYTAKIEMLEDILETVANGVDKRTESALHKHIVSKRSELLFCEECKERHEHDIGENGYKYCWNCNHVAKL